MESRACYGYYGEGHGATGEQPRKNRGGYRINEYYFMIDWHTPFISNEVTVKAKNFKNAERRAKAWAKQDGGTFIGENNKYISLNHYDE